jgi:L-amino acid N-acyltransferase YncA
MQKFSKLQNNNPKLKMRYANNSDLRFTLKLHNSNVSKKKFFSKRKVTLDEHKIWFDKQVKEKMLFIFSLKNRIGYVRYDQIKKNFLSVSIAIKDKYKRKGFGKKMLYKSLKRKKISKFNIIAVIKKQNLISKKFFLNYGFKYFKKNTYIMKTGL